MESVIVWTELGLLSDGEARALSHELRAQVAQPDLVSTRTIREDRGSRAVLVAGVPDPEAALRVAQGVERAAKVGNHVIAEAPKVYIAVQHIGSDEPTRDQNLLTVRLPVPERQEHFWNEWYLGEHMPALLSAVGAGLLSGTRYGAIGGTTDYLVAYDFDSTDSMRAWVDGSGIQGKRSAYRDRWHVINETRAFVTAEDVESG
jgi:hypothetical protein